MNRKAVHQTIATIGAAALLAFSSAGVASARPDPGPPVHRQFRTNITLPYDQKVYEIHHGTTPGTPKAVPMARVVRVDDNALEYLQVGLGTLGGLVLAGAVARAGGARHRHQQPV